MRLTYSTEQYLLLRNTSVEQLSAYGYIYYASLYSSQSHLITLLSILALIGIGSNMLLFLCHFCAIYYARCHLYKPIGSSTTRDASKGQVFSWLRKLASRICRPFRCSSDPIVHPAPHTNHHPPPSVHYPRVAVLKPLAGLERNLEANLQSFFHMTYPNYELIFCVADKTDPVCALVRQLIRSNTHIQAQLIFVQRTVGVNPKVNNLQAGYEHTQAELILISDSGLWMAPDSLTDMVNIILTEPDVGLVHQIPFLVPHTKPLTGSHSAGECVSRPAFSWMVQFVFFACWHAKIYLYSAFAGLNCTTGMSCLLRRATLESLGGLSVFGQYLAEDYFLAKYILDNGLSVRLSHQPAWQNCPSVSVSQFNDRIERWAHLRMSMLLHVYLVEPLSRCFPNAIVGALSTAYLFPHVVDAGVYFLCHVLIWFLLDYMLLIHMNPPWVPLCISKLEYLITWVFCEVNAVMLHYRTLFRRELVWRANRFRIHWGGLTELVQPPVGNKKLTACQV